MEKILIISGIHGDEIASILVARELKGWVEGMGLDNVDVIPEVNREAVELNRRATPKDGKDLNRLFPGKKDGTKSEKIAYELFKKAKEYDKIIDLHTFGSKRVCAPHVLVDAKEKKNRELVEKLGLDYAVQTTGSPGRLFTELSKSGKASVLIEMCGAESLLERDMERVKESLKGLILDQSNKGVKIFEKYEKIRPDKLGKFEPSKKVGQRITKGEVIGTLNDRPVKSDTDGMILGLMNKGFHDPSEGYVAFVAKNE